MNTFLHAMLLMMIAVSRQLRKRARYREGGLYVDYALEHSNIRSRRRARHGRFNSRRSRASRLSPAE
jgi:hypothetical protein